MTVHVHFCPAVSAESTTVDWVARITAAREKILVSSDRPRMAVKDFDYSLVKPTLERCRNRVLPPVEGEELRADMRALPTFFYWSNQDLIAPVEGATASASV